MTFPTPQNGKKSVASLVFHSNDSYHQLHILPPLSFNICKLNVLHQFCFAPILSSDA